MADLGDHFVFPAALFPVALLLQRVDHLLRHVFFVVLGQHGIGLEPAAGLERALRDHALPFAEQVRQDALIADRDGAVAVGHFEAHRKLVAALQACRA